MKAEPSGHPVYLQDSTEITLFVSAGNFTRALPVHEAVRYAAKRWPWAWRERRAHADP